MNEWSSTSVIRIVFLAFTGTMLLVMLGITVIKVLNRFAGSPNTATEEPEEVVGGVVGWLSPVGFIGGIFLACLCLKHSDGFMKVAYVSLAAMLGNVPFQAWKKRRGWELADARCVERELRKFWAGDSDGHNWTWEWRLVCEYEHGGTRHRVTPWVHWITFPSEQKARRFLDKRVSSEGVCKLRFNPNRPLQADLVGPGFVSKVLYWPDRET